MPGKAGRSPTGHTDTSLPLRQAKKSHTPFNSGINDQQERSATKTVACGPTRAGAEQGDGAEGKVPKQRRMGCVEGKVEEKYRENTEQIKIE